MATQTPRRSVFCKTAQLIAPTLAVLLATPLAAATFTVSSNADSGPGTLRQAIADAHATPGPHTIRFNLPLPAVITLTSGQIDMDGPDLVINGPGKDTLRISGNDSSRIFDIGSGRVTISDLSLSNAYVFGTAFYAQRGGAIRIGAPPGAAAMSDKVASAQAPTATAARYPVQGRMDDVPAKRDRAAKDDGALALTLVDVRVHENRAGSRDGSGGTGPGGNSSGGGGGAALYASGAEVAIFRSEFRDNISGRVGAVIINGQDIAHFRIEDSSFIGNRLVLTERSGCCAALLLQQTGGEILRSVFRNNTVSNGVAGLGESVNGVAMLFDGADLLVEDSEFSGNTANMPSLGGSFACLPDDAANPSAMVLRNSTISGNRAEYGAGFGSSCPIQIEHSTISANVTLNESGSGTAGIEMGCSSGRLSATRSILAGNLGAEDLYFFSDCGNPGFGIVEQLMIGVPSPGLTPPAGAIVVSDPKLLPLADNGGRSRTHALAADSPALNAGSRTSTIAYDQRGPGFPRSAGAAPDLGAFEASAVPPTPLRQQGLTGAWLTPATTGQGFNIEIYPTLPSAERGLLAGGWFTYAEGAPGGPSAQRWYTVAGNIDAAQTSARLDIFENRGGRFAEQPITLADRVGTATMHLADCANALFSFAFTDGSGRSGTQPLQRITPNPSCNSAGGNNPTHPDALMSGLYFDPATSGQGLIVELNPHAPVLFGTWYTYANAASTEHGPRQRWFTLQAQYAAGARNFSAVPILLTTGGVFNTPPGAGQTTVQVGTAELSFASCEGLRLTYRFDSGELAGTSGSQQLVRTGPTPAGCNG